MEVNDNIWQKKQWPKRARGRTNAWIGGIIYSVTATVAVLCYINSLDGDFVHDDIFAIKNNADVTGNSSLYNIFADDFWGKPMFDDSSHKSFRPLTVLSFRLNYILGQGSPFSFHIVNVILHSLMTVLFTYVCHTVFSVPRKYCFMAGLLFAVHPIHTEAVSGIVGRADILAGICFLLTILFYSKSLDLRWDVKLQEFPRTRQPVYLVMSLVLSAVAMLCKEHGVMVVGVCATLDVFIFSKRGIHRILTEKCISKNFTFLFGRLVLLSVTLLTLFIYRIWMMNGSLPEFQEEDNPASFSPFLLTRILTYNYLFTYNAWKLLFPSILCYDWQGSSIPLVSTLADPRNLVTITFYIILFLVLYRCLVNFNSEGNDEVNIPFVSLVLLILPFLPASNLLFRVGFVIAERILYLPSMGSCLLIAYGLSLISKKYPRHSSYIKATFILYAIILGSKTWQQNYVWHSRESLFRSGVQVLPGNAKAHYNFGNYLKDTGQNLEAIWHYKRSIQLWPEHASVHNNLGTLLSNQTEAEYHYKEALRIYPQHKGAIVNAGNSIFNRGQKEQGIQMVKQALEIDPHYTEALLTMGRMMMDVNNWVKAEKYIKAAIMEKPHFAKAYNFYGVYYYRQGNYKDAVNYYQQAYTLDTHDTTAMTNAADGLHHLGRVDEAENLLRQALAIKPDMKTMDQLGLLYFRTGRTFDSLAVYKEMLQKSPNNTDAMMHYANVLISIQELDKAEGFISRILSHNPNHIDALRGEAAISSMRGKHKEAIVYLKSAINHAQFYGRDGTFLALMHHDLGNLYKDTKQYDKAVECYHESLRLDPMRSKTHLNLGGIYHIMAKFEKARYHYNETQRLDPNDNIAGQNLIKLDRIERQQKNVMEEQKGNT